MSKHIHFPDYGAEKLHCAHCGKLHTIALSNTIIPQGTAAEFIHTLPANGYGGACIFCQCGHYTQRKHDNWGLA